MSEIVMSQQPVRLDGQQTTALVQEGRFAPESVLEHIYIPLDMVQIKEVGNDLIYMTDYWSVDRYWRVFFHPHTYEILLAKFLQFRTVLVDYRNPKKPRAHVPKDKKADGFTSMFREHTADLKGLSGEELDYMLGAMGYDPIEGTFYATRA